MNVGQLICLSMGALFGGLLLLVGLLEGLKIMTGPEGPLWWLNLLFGALILVLFWGMAWAGRDGPESESAA